MLIGILHELIFARNELRCLFDPNNANRLRHHTIFWLSTVRKIEKRCSFFFIIYLSFISFSVLFFPEHFRTPRYSFWRLGNWTQITTTTKIHTGSCQNSSPHQNTLHQPKKNSITYFFRFSGHAWKECY